MELLLKISWSGIVEWLRAHAISCPSKLIFHMDCPGCGMQRSIFALLEGNLMESLRLYPATIPIFSLLLYTVLHLKFGFRSGALVIKWGYIACLLIIVVFYIYKLFTNKLI